MRVMSTSNMPWTCALVRRDSIMRCAMIRRMLVMGTRSPGMTAGVGEALERTEPASEPQRQHPRPVSPETGETRTGHPR